MSFSIDVYPNPVVGGDYIAVLNDPGSSAITANISSNFTGALSQWDSTRIILVVDRSGSMGDYFNRFLSRVMPHIFSGIGAPEDYLVNVITFDSRVDTLNTNVAQFPSITDASRGWTEMADVMPLLQSELLKLPQNTNVQIIAVSDGYIDDINKSVERANSLSNLINSELVQRGISINAIAVRYGTSGSSNNADTRGLSCYLSFNTSPSSSVKLVDIDASDPPEIQANIILPLLNVSRSEIRLFSSSPGENTGIFQLSPWRKMGTNSTNTPPPTSSVQFTPYASDKPTQTVFWLDKTAIDTLINANGEKNSENSSSTTYDNISVSITGLNDTITPCFHQAPLSYLKYSVLMRPVINLLISQVKVLKVLNSADSPRIINEMVSYFECIERAIEETSPDCEVATAGEEFPEIGISTNSLSYKRYLTNLKKRLQRATTTLSAQLKEVANVDMVKAFNSAQGQAAFLQTIHTDSRAGKNLVKRHMKTGSLDFDAVAIAQAINLVTHFDEFEAELSAHGVDESIFNQSFVSLSTTLDGLRGLKMLYLTAVNGDDIPSIEVSRDNYPGMTLLEQLSAAEIIETLTITGIPVQSFIREYNDPYQFEISAMFPGVYMSLSDLMMARQLEKTQDGPNFSRGCGTVDAQGLYTFNTSPHALSVPGYPNNYGRVDAILPIFEHPLIANFFQKYGDELLSFYASVNIRRVIASINETLTGSLSAGLHKAILTCNTNPTPANYKLLYQIYTTLQYTTPPNYLRPYYDSIFNGVIGCYIQDQRNDMKQYAPSIPFRLVNYIYPLINLYMAVKNNAYPQSLQNAYTNVKKDTPYHLNPTWLPVQRSLPSLSLLAKYLPNIMRAIYTTETWYTFRPVYFRKENSAEILSNAFNSLILAQPYNNSTYTSLVTENTPEMLKNSPIWNDMYDTMAYFNNNDQEQLHSCIQNSAFSNVMKNILNLSHIAQENIPIQPTSLSSAPELSNIPEYQQINILFTIPDYAEIISNYEEQRAKLGHTNQLIVEKIDYIPENLQTPLQVITSCETVQEQMKFWGLLLSIARTYRFDNISQMLAYPHLAWLRHALIECQSSIRKYTNCNAQFSVSNQSNRTSDVSTDSEDLTIAFPGKRMYICDLQHFLLLNNPYNGWNSASSHSYLDGDALLDWLTVNTSFLTQEGILNHSLAQDYNNSYIHDILIARTNAQHLFEKHCFLESNSVSSQNNDNQHSLFLFRYLSLVYAVQYTTQSDRVNLIDVLASYHPQIHEDDAESIPKQEIVDHNLSTITSHCHLSTLSDPISLKNIADVLNSTISSAVITFFTNHILIPLQQSRQSERDAVLQSTFITQLYESTTIEQFIELLRSGITHTAPEYTQTVFTFKFQNQAHPGALVFFTKLSTHELTTYLSPTNPTPKDWETQVQLRQQKIALFLLAKHWETDEVIWNNGNHFKPPRLDLCDARKWFIDPQTQECNDFWINNVIRVYYTRQLHTYRTNGSNRHGHSNDKPSYWALGYDTIDAYQSDCSAEDWANYLAIHTNCCGFSSSP